MSEKNYRRIEVFNWTIALLLVCCSASLEVWAAQATKQIRAVRAKTPPRTDGRLDDEAWSLASFAGDFVQRDPLEGAPAVARTEVAFVYDDAALYVGARMYSDAVGEIRALITRRDRESSSEQLIVSLDTYLDRRTAYSFGVTAAGVRLDYLHPEDDGAARDYSYNPVWEAATQRDAQGWTAEMRIPFSQLRFNDGEVQVWGVNLVRATPAHNREEVWVLVPKSETGWASRFGELHGIVGVRPALGFELFPYIASSSARRSVETENPFSESGETDGRLGAEVRMRLGPSLALEATFNPDFGQVEADPAEVNLSQFETFFSERRPFFAENRQFFGGDTRFFYTRRVGASPRGGTTGDFEERPDNTTILGAGKVTGRLPSGLSIGSLVAVTDEEYARTFTTSSDSFGREKVEPLALYAAARVQQEFGDDASTAGLMLMALQRDVEADEPLAQLLNRRAFSGQGDFNLRFAGGGYTLKGELGFSQVEGEPESIERFQRSSTSYFQRPDATHVDLDTTRTSLSGMIGLLEMRKRAGEHWLWTAAGRFESPSFNRNDMGIQFTSDDIDFWVELVYRQTKPTLRFQDYNVSLRVFPNWNFGGTRGDSNVRLNIKHTWRNFMSSSVFAQVWPREQDDRATRGGPLMASPAGAVVEVGLSSNPARRTTWYGGLNAGAWETDVWEREVYAGVSLRPSGRWELAIDPSFSRSANSRQYIEARDGASEATFGRRYIFATVERSRIATQFRFNYAIDADLTLQTYVEPFAASGRFADFGELAAVRSRDLRLYGADGTTLRPADRGGVQVTDGADSFTIDHRDFRTRSLRSTVVLRWEWRPGSTFFAIWQQDRGSTGARGNAVGVADLWRTWSAEGENVLALKLRYWLPLG